MRDLLHKPTIVSMNLQKWIVALWALSLAVMLTTTSSAFGQNSPAKVTHFRTSYLAELGAPRGAGLSLSPLERVFLVLEADDDALPDAGFSRLQLISQFDGLVDSLPAAVPVADPINLTFDSDGDRWFLLDSKSGMVIEIGSDSHGRPDPVTLKRYKIQGLDIQEPLGMTYDSARGRLVILDGAGPSLVSVDVADWPMQLGEVWRIDLSATGLDELRGVAFDPTSRRYHVYEPARQMLHELSEEGLVQNSRDLSEIAPENLQGLLFAPSADRTDDPAQHNLYLVDGQTPAAPELLGREASNDPAGNPGRLVEAYLLEVPAAATADFTSTLVQTLNTSQWSKPSPDPSGLAYLPGTPPGTLLIVDGEVEEEVGNVTHFEGANVWETDLEGTVLNTANISDVPPTVVPMTEEPTGAAWNPANGHYYFSDDNMKEVFDLDPGADEQVGTADDTWTSFDTQADGSADPEGIAFDSWHNHLFVVDGVNQEVYEYTLSGALVNHFDVARHGVPDPEGIEFNADTGTLFVLSSSRFTPIVIETTTGGALIQTIDISASGARTAAGIAHAPASDGSETKRFYLVDRGIDNDTDPDIIDGKFIEMTAPIDASVPQPPLANDDDVSALVNTPLLIDAAANDFDPNGDLDPSTTNITCGGCSGPNDGALVNHGDGSFTYTPDAGFIGDDSFVYQICDEGGLCDTALVSIAVGSSTLDVRISASSDDAEEAATGSVSLTSSDLELVLGGSIQTVGLRFNGITIPQGAVISRAFIQFQVDETPSDVTNLIIEGEDNDHAVTFSEVSGNVSARARTSASIAWAPVLWTTVGEAGPDQQTPDIAAIIQEIVQRPGWASGNSLAIIISGEGKRVAEAYDGVAAAAPLLHIEYTFGGNLPPVPVISAPADGASFIVGSSVTFTGSASDDEDGDLTSSLTWTSSLDGAIGSGASFSRSDLSMGVHVITVEVTDSGGLTASDSVSLNIITDSPILVGAGDIAYCTSDGDEQTADLLDAIPGTVFTLGDNANPDGSAADFSNCYDPSWGRHKARTYPIPGNHDYDTPGASAYYDYFGAAAGDPTKGYYSYDVGEWHIIALNSECSNVGGCETYSPQGQWLQADLEANQNECVMAYFHRPLFSSDYFDVDVQDFWSLLYQHGADIVLNGHSHTYERFAPQDPYGALDLEHGIREFVVGTGAAHGSFNEMIPNSEVQGESAGVLKLILNPGNYEWEFISIAGETFTDSGSSPCVSPAPANNPPDAVDDAAATDEDVAVNITVLANDSDLDGDDLTVSLVLPGPSNGTAVVEVNQSITYTPTANFNGVDSFTYLVSDGNGGADTATVTVTVNAVNDPPLANNDVVSTDEDTAVNIDVLANDSDADGDALTVSPSLTGPSNGAAVVEIDQSITYTPNANFNGVDSFTYDISDGHGGSNTATVTVTVNAVNDPPLANDDSANIEEDTVVNIDVLANDSDADGDALTVSPSLTGPSNGSAVVEIDQSITYTPNTNFNGADSFTYAISDGNGGSDTAVVNITVNPVADPPQANDDAVSTDEDVALTIDVAANDTDPDGDLVPATANTGCVGCALPENGTLINNLNGSFVYTPSLGFVGLDSFVYEICDATDRCATATVTITVTLVNDPPVANDDSTATPEDAAVTIDVTANDTDPDGNMVPETANTGCAGCATPVDGTLLNNLDGSFTYTPTLDFNGLDSFVYEVCDTQNECDTAVVNITVNPVADPPQANDDAVSTDEDVALTIDVAANDTDPDGDLVPATANTGCVGCALPENGTLINNLNGSFVYTPSLGFVGLDNFVYEICDSEATCDTAAVTITVNLVNDPPVANDDSAATLEDTPLTITVTANDTDPDGNLDETTANTGCAGCATPVDGTLLNNLDGSFTYTPTLDFNGPDSFVYEVCDTLGLCDTATVTINITAVADSPLAVDDSASTYENTTVTINVAANDSDPDGDLDPTTANVACATCSVPGNGTLTNNGDGSFNYGPDLSFVGNDSFVYEICDATASCATATVTITVSAIVPVALDIRIDSSSDDAEEQGTGRVSLTSSDLELVLDKDLQTVGLRFNGVTIPQGSTITTATIQFQADEINSEVTALTIEGQADDNALTFNSEKFSISNTSLRPRTAAAVPWAPAPWTEKGAAGPDQQTPDIAPVIQEIVGRPGWASGNSLAIIISGTGKRVVESFNGDAAGAPLLHVEYIGLANDPPLANDDSAGTDEDTVVTVDVAANDTDPDGNLVQATANTACATCAIPVNGALANLGNGAFDYTPNLNYNGVDSFVYEICDALNICDTATVTITIDPVNDPPLAVDDSVTTNKDTAVSINAASNDSDVDGDLDPTTANIACDSCAGPANGALANNGDGSFIYTPTLGFTGSDSFVYAISDTGSLSDTATVNITVTPTNDPPLAQDDSATTDEDTSTTIDVAANDTDPDGNLVPSTANTACIDCTEPANGNLFNNLNGTFSYTPAINFNGLDSFVYEICDSFDSCATATVSITVTAVNDPPVAVDDSAATIQDTPLTIDVAENDTDPDDNLDPTTTNTLCDGCAEPANGNLANNSDGTFTYTPNPGFTGNDSFIYAICDTDLLCASATVNITISGQPAINTLYITTSGSATAGGISFRDEDIMAYDIGSATWSMYFDGTDVGLDLGQEIDALHVNEDGSILLSLGSSDTLPDVGAVDEFDILHFIPTALGDNTAGAYELYFDGSDVGLAGEDIDALGFTPDGRLVISLRGSYSVGGISGGDEDMLAFTATSLGETTSGSWELYIDGSDVDLNDNSGEDINGAWLDADGKIYLSVRGTFSVVGLAGDADDIFTCLAGSLGDVTSCTFDPFWDGSAFGLAGEDINGFFLGP